MKQLLLNLIDNNKFIGILRISMAIYMLYYLLTNALKSITLNPTNAEQIGELIGGFGSLILFLVMIYYYLITGYSEIKDKQKSHNRLRMISIIWAGLCFIAWMFISIRLLINLQLAVGLIGLLQSVLILVLIVKDIRIIIVLQVRGV
jgi:hypothetical protein